MKVKLAFLMILLTICLSSTSLTAGETEVAETIDRQIRSTVEALGVSPALSVAVVKGDEVILLKGYGTGGPDTAYYIASSTKSFTALAAALLAGRGELDLDAPFATYLPEAEIAADNPITVRDLLTHTSGLRNMAINIRTAYTGEHDTDTLLRLIGMSQIRERNFNYDNLGYVIVSLILDRVSDGSWRDVLRREIFEPLKMTRTTARVSEIEGWEIAAPHEDGIDGLKEIEFLKDDSTMHAAGGMISTARDLAVWLRVQLNEGRLGDRQVFPPPVIAETHRRQATTDADFYEFHRNGYGLGWYVSTYHEEILLHHFGGFAGYRAHVSFMPEHGLGVVALTNTSGDGFMVPDIVAAQAYDTLLGTPNASENLLRRAVDYARSMEQSRARRAAHLKERGERPWTLSLPRDAYTGTFESEILGTATISLIDEDLVMSVGKLTAPLTPFTAPDSGRAELIPGSGMAIIFVIEDGRVKAFDTQGMRFERIQ